MAERRGYVFARAGYQSPLGPVGFWIVVGALALMAGWTIGTATYLALRDDVLSRLLARKTEMQGGYESRIAELQAEIDRLNRRRRLDQEQFERRLEQLVHRQSALESRAAALGGMTERVGSGPLSFTTERPVHATGRVLPGSQPPPRPASVGRQSSLGGRHDHTAKGSPVGPGDSNVNDALLLIEQSLDRIEAAQVTALNGFEERFRTHVRRINDVFAEIGMEIGKAAAARSQAMGGPFVSTKPTANAFAQQLHRVNLVKAEVERLTRVLSVAPVRKPVSDEVESSSGFGVRIDPFLGVPAMHTGHDFRAASGEPVYAAASGTVTSADWNGGYGKMVEIEHDRRVSTRYAHLAQVLVSAGQKVKAGQMIGRVGSTGRSTGPHLHYEIRVAGEPVDPVKFLQAGARLATP